MRRLLLVGLFACLTVPTPPASAAASCLGQSAPRVVFIGDSMTQGTGQGGGEAGSWIWQLAGACGWHSIWNDGKGSTGSIADSHGKGANYLDRVPTDVAPVDPNLVFVTGYYNDRGHPATDIADAFDRLIAALQALPSHPAVIVTGSYDPTGRNGQPYVDIDQALAAVCAARAVPYIEPRTGMVFDAAGRPRPTSGPWITDANRSQFVGPDGVHQSVDGQHYTAQRMLAAIEAIS